MNGVIIVDKEKDYTSRDVVNIVSKLLNTKQIGHTGTLDPIATGVLVLTIGKATKLSEIITSEYKEYIATVKLGILTDTLDVTGNIIKEEYKSISKDKILNILNSYNKTYMQEVPIYSAVKINGKKLYQYARNNEKIELPKREVTIENIELLDFNNDEFTFKCRVSKGTYIRSLIKDICEDLNTIGVMKELRRIKQGNFDIKDSYTLEDIKNNNYKIINIEDCLKDFKTIIVDNELDILNGKILDNIYNEPILFKNKNNELLSLYKIYEKDTTKIKPWKMFKTMK